MIELLMKQIISNLEAQGIKPLEVAEQVKAGIETIMEANERLKRIEALLFADKKDGSLQ